MLENIYGYNIFGQKHETMKRNKFCYGEYKRQRGNW